MIYEQKYLECLEIGNYPDAIQILRNNLKKTCKNSQKLHKLARFFKKIFLIFMYNNDYYDDSLVMCKNSDYLSKKVDWEGNLQKKRKKLLANIKKINKTIDMLDANIMEVKLKIYFNF